MAKSSLGINTGTDAKIATIETVEDGETRHVERMCEFLPEVEAGDWVIEAGTVGTESEFIDVSEAVKGVLILVETSGTPPS